MTDGGELHFATRANVSDGCLSVGERHTQPQYRPASFLPATIQSFQRRTHCEGRLQRGMDIFSGVLRAKVSPYRHQTIPYELVDRAAMRQDQIGHGRKVFVQM